MLHMARRYLLLFALLVALPVCGDAPFSKGLLFRVQFDNETPSYLFGTMHSDHPDVVRIPAVVKQAFDDSRVLVLETSLDPENLVVAMALMVSEEQQDLQSLLGESVYRRCLAAAEDAGIAEPALPYFRPWALAMLFSVPSFENGRFLDWVLYQAAQERGKQVQTLESAQEQLAGLSDLSLEDQLALLEDALNNRPELPMFFRKLKAAYLERDLGALVSLSREGYQQQDAGRIARLEEALIYARNRRMSDRLDDLLSGGGRFVAVWALHLPGNQGLLALLQSKGFRVDRVY